MRTIIALLAFTTFCLAAEVPYNPAGSSPVSKGNENLEEVNAKLSERLKQEQGSEEGVYHVYLQDGRLQKVQYTTAPISSGQQLQQQQAASNYKNQQQTPLILSQEFAEKRGVYFVQVPQERVQALQANAQQASQQSQNFQPSAPAQYNQQETSPVNVRYLPLEDTPAQTYTPGSSSQYNQVPSAEPVVRFLPVPLTEEVGQYRQVVPRGYQAVVQYSEVQPIQGPVYSYKPEGLTRILRYAPVY